MSRPHKNAAQPLYQLITGLAHVSWGPLGSRSYQGVRALLSALGRMLHPRYGTGQITVGQLAHDMAYSERWVSQLLYWAEDFGLVMWQRGMIIGREPVPGFIRVNKRVLADLINVATPASDQCQADRAARTRARLAKIPTPAKLKNNTRQNRRSLEVEVSSNLPPSKGKSRAGFTPRPATHPTVTKENDMNPVDYEPYLPVNCNHLTKNPFTCNTCRHDAYEQSRAAKRKASESDKALIRAYAKAIYPGRTWNDCRRFAIADWKAGDVHRWQQEQMRQGLLADA